MAHSTDPRQVVLITGCSAGGIGWSLADQFSNSGYRVFATARDPRKIIGLSANLEQLALDVTDQKSVDEAVSQVIQTAGKIDILVNNAGTNVAVGPVVDTDLQRFRDTYEANYFGLIRVCQAVAPHMIKARRGKIVNIGSTAAYSHLPYSAAYSSSKAAVHSFSEILGHELAGFGIDVVIVAPGAIQSNIGNAGAKDLHVPEGSAYKNVEDMIRYRAAYSQLGRNTPSAVFAKKVVKTVTKRSPPIYLTTGAKSPFAFLLYYLPARLRKWIMSRVFQMWRVGGGAVKRA